MAVCNLSANKRKMKQGSVNYGMLLKLELGECICYAPFGRLCLWYFILRVGLFFEENVCNSVSIIFVQVALLKDNQQISPELANKLEYVGNKAHVNANTELDLLNCANISAVTIKETVGFFLNNKLEHVDYQINML